MLSRVFCGHGCSVRLVEPGDGSAPSVEWAGDSRWMEVSIGLVGEEGSMRALGPTLHLPTQARPSAPRATLRA